jgi:hypothetical protein
MASGVAVVVGGSEAVFICGRRSVEGRRELTPLVTRRNKAGTF